jgi:hypothetical protein
MKVYIKSVFFGFTLFLSNVLCAGPAEELVIAAFSFEYSETFVKTEKFAYNLKKYEATFKKHALAKQVGFVDAGGRYIIIGSKIVTKQTQIRDLLAQSTLLPNKYSIFNLLAYEWNNPGHKQIIFVDNQDRYAIVGGSVDGINGISTFRIANHFIPQDLANFLYSQRDTTGSFLQGQPNAPKTIYVFFEPNCPFCHELYEGLKSYVQSGELSIHWSAVAFIHPNSWPKARAILDGKVPPGANFSHTPHGALAYNEEFFDVAADQGGIPPSKHPSFDAKAILNRSSQFFLVYGPPGVPFIIYKNTEGLPAYFQGVPPHIARFVDKIYAHTNSSNQ